MSKKTLKNEKETRELAVQIAQELLKEDKKESATVIALEGDLGVGKTTFTQSFAKALGIKKRVLSPTFLIMKRFPTPNSKNFENLYHIDAYRVGKDDLEDLNFEEIIQKPNVVLIEWANRVKSILPKDTIWLRFKHGKRENERHLTINRR